MNIVRGEKPRPVLFLDANIYLTLYETEKAHKLLEALVFAKPWIFITEQIADEVRRRQLAVFVEKQAGFLKGMPQIKKWPDRFDESADIGKEWADRIRFIGKEIGAVRRRYLAITEQISSQSDPLSRKLEILFEDASPASPSEWVKARKRKERGHPPGKGGKLCDELSWEQLLGVLTRGQSVWLVTNDMDYMSMGLEGPQLHPALCKEVMTRIGNGSLSHFRTLSEALQDFDQKGADLKYLPSKKKLDQINLEEQKANTDKDFITVNYSLDLTGAGWRRVGLLGPEHCPKCMSGSVYFYVRSTPTGSHTEYQCDTCFHRWP